LSKAWKLIDRFSEDIDLVIERDYLGFGGASLSRNRVNKLKDACSARIDGEIRPTLQRRIDESFPVGLQGAVTLAGPEVDPDRLTLLFAYPTVLPVVEAGYIKREVKLEFGARSETEPAERPVITPFLAEQFPGLFSAPELVVKTIAARRTFWEKAMLLHEEAFRPAGRPLKRRLSRHYYDLSCLIQKGTAAKAVEDEGLFDRIARHRKAFFRQTWVDYKTLKRGTLRLRPPKERLVEWRQDYQAMRDDMFFAEPPEFEAILGAVGQFENDFNRA
jgi:hypothetical protein